jgi:hypothetical protein
MLSDSNNPFNLVSFLMLRLVNLEALSSMPTWSTLGDKVKSGKRLNVFSAIDLFVIFKITTIVLHGCKMQQENLKDNLYL